MSRDSELTRRAFVTVAGGCVPAWGKMIEGKEVVVGSGAVASEPEDTVRAAAAILEAGGNAMDAAAAAALVCGLLQPELCGPGGYVLCGLVLEGKTGRIWSLDANSVSPAAARERMFEVLPLSSDRGGINAQEYHCAVRDDANVLGPLAVGVPGQMAGLGILWERWGRLKWPDIVAPSQRLVAAGIPYRITARSIAVQEKTLRRFEATSRLLMPDGRLPKPADRWRPDDLAKTLTRLAAAGWRDFYEGELGRKIADFVSGAGGALSRADMAEFHPRVAEPYLTTYRGARVYSAALANGGLTVLQILNMLECLAPASAGDVVYWHRLAEVLKLAWRDRLRYLGDPDGASVPVERLLSKDYAAGRVETLRQFPDQVDRMPAVAAGSSPGTTHISAADRDGNLVAVTVSHGGNFGSCLTVPGTGIILGHGMCRFDPRPGRPNSVGPRKRPLNNVCPTILRLPDRDVALGLRGGRRIVSSVAQVAARIVDHGLTALEAVEAPRMHVEEQEPLELMTTAGREPVEKLEAMGHRVRQVERVGGWTHIVERLRNKGKIRAGSNIWSAGIE
ncbi:MAG: gamma-glutamyltransferase [Candidatus Solibacter usitatus]|nr:gamma-glutamyltransferase [Candidatus Solibacter usitatus]